jgi:hypothetical protein
MATSYFPVRKSEKKFLLVRPNTPFVSEAVSKKKE